MEKKLNYKLLNILIVLAILYMLYLLKDFGGNVYNILVNILKPFVVGFALAYAFYPFVRMLRKKLPKWLSILILLAIILSICTFIILSVLPVFTNQLTSLFKALIEFINGIDNISNIDLTPIKNSFTDYINEISNNASKYISDGALSFVNASINFVSNFIISLVAFIYFLIDMDNIRDTIKLFSKKTSKKFFNLMEEIDDGMSNYFKGLLMCIIIQFIEYTTIFYLIGHPNFLLLGLICSISTIIPYFGGIIANIVAVITASVVSTKLLILTLIVAFICPNIDGYFISPKVYGKTNQLSPLVSIFAVFAGGVIKGFTGILVALPVAIIIQTIYKNYKKEIKEKLEDIKG